MKKLLLTALAFSLSVVFAQAKANQNPRGLATDSRIKVVAYDPNDVVRINGNHLVSTNIVLGSDEVITDVNNGDAVAWSIEKSKRANVLTVKPKLPQSDTNLMVYTTKRIYNFQLVTQPSYTPNSKNVTYLLQFKYPEEEKSMLQAQLNDLQRTVFGTTNDSLVPLNDNYSFVGSPAIAPIKAVDNGTFTLFVFKKNTPVPAIFSVDRHQNESLINFKADGDKIYIQGVHHQYTLRNGEEVTTVYNDSTR